MNCKIITRTIDLTASEAYKDAWEYRLFAYSGIQKWIGRNQMELL